MEKFLALLVGNKLSNNSHDLDTLVHCVKSIISVTHLVFHKNLTTHNLLLFNPQQSALIFTQNAHWDKICSRSFAI